MFLQKSIILIYKSAIRSWIEYLSHIFFAGSPMYLNILEEIQRIICNVIDLSWHIDFRHIPSTETEPTHAFSRNIFMAIVLTIDMFRLLLLLFRICHICFTYFIRSSNTVNISMLGIIMMCSFQIITTQCSSCHCIFIHSTVADDYPILFVYDPPCPISLSHSSIFIKTYI